MYKKFLKIRSLFFTEKGFTLTEMMAVAVILAILSAVLVGNFRTSLEKARFNEGLQAVEAVAAAMEEYYYANQDINTHARMDPTFDQLDIGLSNAQPCVGGVPVNNEKPYCRKIKNFEVQIAGTTVSTELHGVIPAFVSAYRGEASAGANDTATHKYIIMAVPPFVRALGPLSGIDRTTENQISLGGWCAAGRTANGTDRKGADICYAMGYTQKCSDLNQTADVTVDVEFCKP